MVGSNWNSWCIIMSNIQVKPLILIETDLMFLKRETSIYMYGNYIATTKFITNMTKKRKRDWLAKWLLLGFTDYRRRELLGFRHRVLNNQIFPNDNTILYQNAPASIITKVVYLFLCGSRVFANRWRVSREFACLVAGVISLNISPIRYRTTE